MICEIEKGRLFVVVQIGSHTKEDWGWVNSAVDVCFSLLQSRTLASNGDNLIVLICFRLKREEKKERATGDAGG